MEPGWEAVTISWWDDAYGRWSPYHPTQQITIRHHLQTHDVDLAQVAAQNFADVPPVTITIPGYGDYELDFSHMIQINTATRFSRRIQIADGTNPPPDTMLTGGDSEYEDDYEENENDEKDPIEDPRNLFQTIEVSTLSSSDLCVLCLEHFSAGDDVVIPLHCTGHYFHKKCPNLPMSIAEYMEQSRQCPACKKRYGVSKGNMPRGQMEVVRLDMSLPGHEESKTLEITFHFPGGIQGENHPHPGSRYESDYRTAYLPDSPEGQHVLNLIRKAWDRKVLFTIGTSLTRGLDNCIVYNGVHFKTVPCATPSEPWGWPDPTYLLRVTQELNDKGIF